MPTSAEARATVLVDTSAAVALVVSDHEHHRATVDALGGRSRGLAGHAWFETYSVLTRLPPPMRRSPSDVLALLEHDFPDSRFLDARIQRSIAAELPGLGIAGGAVYDALVAATARHHGLRLVTRDVRAVDVYGRLGLEPEILR